MLVDRAKNLSFLKQSLHRRDIVEPDYEDIIGFAGRPDRRYGTESHAVIGTEDSLEIRILGNLCRGDWFGLRCFPVTGLGADDVHPAYLHCIFETELALNPVERVGNPLDDCYFVTRFQFARKVYAGEPGAFAIVRPDEGNLDTLVGKDGGIELVIDIDDDNPGIHRLFAHRNQSLGIGRSDHNRINFLGHYRLDVVNLLCYILLVLDADNCQIVLIGVFFVVGDGAFLHCLEKLVRQRLHYQGNFRFARLAPLTAGRQNN